MAPDGVVWSGVKRFDNVAGGMVGSLAPGWETAYAGHSSVQLCALVSDSAGLQLVSLDLIWLRLTIPIPDDIVTVVCSCLD